MNSRLTQNTLTLFISNGGGAILSFALSVLIGRGWGEANLGSYATVMAWVFPLSFIAEYGIGTLTTRDIAQQKELGEGYLRSSLIFRSVTGGLLMLGLWVIAPNISTNPDIISGLRIASPLIFILPTYSSFTAIFRAKQVMRPIAWLNIGMLLSQVILTFIVLSLRGDILQVLWVNTLTSLAQLLAAFAVYWYGFHIPSNTRVSIKDLIHRATPFAIGAILAITQLRIGFILLEQFTDTQQVGQYAAATRFVEAGRMIPNALFGALFPALSIMVQDQENLQRTFRKFVLGLAGYGVLFGITMSLTAMWIIPLTYGEDFVEAIPLLQIAGWVLLPTLIRNGRALYWYARGYETFANIVSLVLVLLQILGCILLIPRLGAVGVIIVSIVVEAIGAVLIWRPFIGTKRKRYAKSAS